MPSRERIGAVLRDARRQYCVDWNGLTVCLHSVLDRLLRPGNQRRYLALIRDGLRQWEEMARRKISERGQLQSVRVNGLLEDPALVKLDGSVIQRNHRPYVVTISVEAGVQTGRIELM